jgi:hypothetical protein
MSLICKRNKFSSYVSSFSKEHYLRQPHASRSYATYFFVIIACLLLGLTNATNDITHADNVEHGLVGKVKTYVTHLWNNIQQRSVDNSTTANETIIEHDNSSLTSIFRRPFHMSDIRLIFSAFLGFLAQLFMIVSIHRIR